MKDLINKEFLKRVLSVVIFIPIVIFPIIYSNYFSLLIYLIFNTIIVYELSNMKNKNVNTTFINCTIIISTFSFFFFLLILITKPDIKNIIILIILTIWAFDTFSYLGGKIIGGKKLMPSISAGKTYSGLVVGITLTLVVAQIYQIVNFGYELINLIFTILIIFLSFFGDIYASILKRVSSVKDSSNYLPGHGGFYDRFDSFIGVFFIFGLFGIFL